MRFRLSLFVVALSASTMVAGDAPVAWTVSPAGIEIRHYRQPHSIQVLGSTGDGYSVDLRSQAVFVSADPKVATVDTTGWVQPVGNGITRITVTLAGQSSKTIDVKVMLPPAEPSTSFRHEVMPVLTKAGCNAGACHGYSLGKNGFKLSLRGQDPNLDLVAIARDMTGRRICRQTPSASLIIAKGRGDVAHEGGMRFSKGSLTDRILTSWVAQGTPEDLGDPAQVVRVRVIPDTLTLKPGDRHRLQLIADYSNGTARDVTRFGIFTANNTQFATVDDDGLVRGGDAGETAIVARFERVFAATSVTVLRPVSGFVPTPVPTDHFIDRHVVGKLNRMRLTPSPVAGDEEFLRRVYLDLIGVQPKPEEVRAFAADKDPKKREKIVEALFERPEFVDQWSLKWGDLLQNSRNTASSQSVYLFREYIRGAVAANTPLDEFARKLLTARGGVTENPAAGFFAVSKDTNETVERVTQVFCGVRMLCARCHPHPLENYTQADYYGLASFFNQVSARPDGRFPQQPNTKLVAVNTSAGFALNPRTGKLQPPRFLGGEEPTLSDGKDRREAYAEWLTSPKNALFARGLVNRIWSYFFHRGIIDPVDDIRSTNPPINPALLDALTQDFIDHKFDARHLMKRIITSATYQRTSAPNDSNRNDEQNFSHSIPRRIPAEALFDSLIQATGVPENFAGAPGGFRAAQLPDGNIENDFLRLFGKPQRMDACECERDNGSNMLQALNFLNGKSILSRVKNPAARPAILLRDKKTDEQIVSELYLWTLARTPTEKELKLGLAFLKEGASDRTAAVQDFMWALLNSKDFLLVN
jgi:hypothetical protein